MLIFEDYKTKWPESFDRICEWAEENRSHYTSLADNEKRALIGNLIAEDKDMDLSPQDLRDWMKALIENPSDTRAGMVANRIYLANKRLIDSMFSAASEHLDATREINLFIDNDFRGNDFAATVRGI
jgi:hypothetical protein